MLKRALTLVASLGLSRSEVGELAVDAVPADLAGVPDGRFPELQECCVEGGLPYEQSTDGAPGRAERASELEVASIR